MRLVAFAIALAIMTAAAACGPAPSTEPAPTPEVSCSETRFNPPPKLTCGVAIAVARAALPFLHPRIVRIEFGWGGWCPPFMRCLATIPVIGHVIFRFASGEPLLVDVAIDEATGIVSVTGSQPLPSVG